MTSDITITCYCENPWCDNSKDILCHTAGRTPLEIAQDIAEAYRFANWEGICRPCRDRDHDSYEAAKRDALR